MHISQRIPLPSIFFFAALYISSEADSVDLPMSVSLAAVAKFQAVTLSHSTDRRPIQLELVGGLACGYSHSVLANTIRSSVRYMVVFSKISVLQPETLKISVQIVCGRQ